MKALIFFGYVLVSVFISGIVYLIAKLLIGYYNHFIHHESPDKGHLKTGL